MNSVLRRMRGVCAEGWMGVKNVFSKNESSSQLM